MTRPFEWQFVSRRLGRSGIVCLVLIGLATTPIQPAAAQSTVVRELPPEAVRPDLIRACAPFLAAQLRFVRQNYTISQYPNPTRLVNEEEARQSLIEEVDRIIGYSRDDLSGDIQVNRDTRIRHGKGRYDGAIAFGSCLLKRRAAQLDGKVSTGRRGG